MEVLKKFGLFTVATVVVVIAIIWCLDAFGFRSPVFAFLLNWLGMSWAAIGGQVIQVALPPRYYDIKDFERSGQVYERLGIRLFKRLVRRGPLTFLSPTLRFPKDRSISALQQLDSEMRRAETGHVIIFAVIVLFMCYALLRGWFVAAGWILLFNVIINGYPIMLQRYNRILLQELIQRLSA